MSVGSHKEIESVIDELKRLNDQLDGDPQRVVGNAAALLAACEHELKRLQERVRWLEGKPYRAKKDQAPEGQLAFDLLAMLAKKIDQGKGEAQADESTDADSNAAPTDEGAASAGKKPKRKRRGRELEVKLVTCRLEESERTCTCCGRTKQEMGFDTRKRFIFEPAKVYVLEEQLYKYGCTCGKGGVAAATPTEPPKPIPGSMASASLLAHLVVAKILDGLPIERVAKGMRRHGIDLATSTLNDWYGATARMFALIHALLLEELRGRSLISLDDTPLPARNRGHPRGIQRGRQWLYLGDLDRVAYAEFSPDWKGRHPRRVLEGFGGDIQGDGYAGINPLFTRADGPRRIGCSDHARRKLVEALKQGDSRVQTAVDLYRALYAVEAVATKGGYTPEQRLALRQTESVPLWSQLTAEMANLALTGEKKTPLGKAITYWTRQYATLGAFLTDGRLPISNAHVERQLRLVAIFRKNCLWVGSLEAGERFAILLTIVLNCILCGANPYDYFVDVITKVASDWPAARAAELLPRAWLAARKCEEQLDGDAALVAQTTALSGSTAA